ncbi:hypothetical protein KAFR_0F03090 [Kazachstania africana CBS 2517]|uniref:MIF4G domain-containing protein n=1 Tax=Kazachstania africana (strain ATCC 22294 / BCRC 22015 / CBS 2517 / CECT 1963 / NBRC 1671 / NRRL Y-8276) TaxID=1071382 RepID=H2AX05_KAZAF|nr:hypothetical protein KAFR_0F03090 [Kazachstania africana CBS 2517]CCF58905.1 hypothetical protein KAFR_0F03090 [Kazachstania africana CBS 2517]
MTEEKVPQKVEGQEEREPQQKQQQSSPTRKFQQQNYGTYNRYQGKRNSSYAGNRQHGNNKYNNGNRYNNESGSGHYYSAAKYNGHYRNSNRNSIPAGNMNGGWPNYYMPQMYYMAPQMAAAMGTGMPVDMPSMPPLPQPPHLSPPPTLDSNVSPNSSVASTPNQVHKKIEITTKSGKALNLNELHSQLKSNSNSAPSSRDETPSVPLHDVSANTNDSIEPKESTPSDKTVKAIKEDTEDSKSKAEQIRKDFLEQVRLRKLQMDKNKNKGKESIEETTTEGKVPDAKELPETANEAPVSNSEVSSTKTGDEANREPLYVPEAIKREEETPESSEKIITFAERLKLKKQASTSGEIKSVHKEVSFSDTTTTIDNSEKEDSPSIEVQLEATTEDDTLETFPEGVTLNMSQFLDRLSKVKPISDIYSFKYPSPIESPDTKYKKVHAKYTYGPTFLLQFKDNVTPIADEEWITSTQSKIIILAGMGSGNRSQRLRENRSSVSLNGGQNRNMSMRNDGRSNSRSMSKRQQSRRYDEKRSNRSSYISRKDREKANEDKPKEEVAPLVPSANRWIPRSKAKTIEKKLAPDGVTELISKEDIERKTKSLLNKLTLEKFDPISADLLAMANQSKWETNGESLKDIIEYIFLKACDEPFWSSMYAQLCAKMVKDIDSEIKDENNESKVGPKLVLHYLVVRCHTEFEKGWADKLPTNEDGSPLEPEMMSDEYYAAAAAKRRGLGLVRFIGFLYRLNLLSGKMMFECFRRLMKDLSDNPSEDVLESVVELLTTVGEQFESDSFNAGKGTLEGSVLLDSLFQIIQNIIDENKIPSRIKFKLIDVKELREHKGWNSEKNNAGPKTIQEIHDEDEKERQLKANSRANSRRSTYTSSVRGSSNNNHHNFSSGSSRNPFKREASRDNFVSSTRSASNRFNQRNQPKSEQQTTSRPTLAANRFDALMGAGEED